MAARTGVSASSVVMAMTDGKPYFIEHKEMLPFHDCNALDIGNKYPSFKWSRLPEASEATDEFECWTHSSSIRYNNYKLSDAKI